MSVRRKRQLAAYRWAMGVRDVPWNERGGLRNFFENMGTGLVAEAGAATVDAWLAGGDLPASWTPELLTTLIDRMEAVGTCVLPKAPCSQA